MPDALHDGLILASHETADQEASVGGKGMNLTRLVRGGLQVPPFFVVGTACFRACVDQDAVREAIQSALADRDVTVLAEGEAASEQIRQAILAAPADGLEELVAQGLDEAIPAQGDEQPFVAVRSSCVGEDSAEASFAGQMDSYLFVRGAAGVAEAVKKCWASAFGARALAYRVQKGMDPAAVDMAVVVQEMIGGEVSGVMFTACPTTGHRDRVVISSTWGLGEGLVSGELAADTFSTVKATGELIEQDLQPKEARVVFDTGAGGGTKTEPVPEGEREQASLAQPHLVALTTLARSIEALYDGEYQDIEWTRRRDQLYLLQARPITQLPPPPPEGFERLWDNSNIIESYSGVTSPMTFSHIRYAYGIAYRESCEIWGLPRETIKDLDQTFNSMLGLIDGNVYYNLESWYKLLSAFPNFEENAAHMEQMLGVRESAEVILSRVLATMPRYSAKQQRAIFWAGLRNFRRTDTLTAEFMRNFREVYDQYDGSDWDALSLQELYAAFQDIRKRMLWRWQAPLVTDALAMRFVGKLKELTVQYGLDETGGFQNDLLCGEGGIESAEPTNMLIRMAEQARGDAPLKAFLEETPNEEVMGALAERKDLAHFKQEVDTYLRKYGFRCMNELKLEETSLRDDPSFLFSMLKNYLRQEDLTVEALEGRQQAKRAEAEATARKKLGLFQRWRYFWVLDQARKHVKNRENMRFCRTRGFGLFRELLNAMGRKFVERGELDDPHDIFYLEVEEVMGWVDGTVSCTDLRGLAGVRKAEYAKYRERPEPDDRIVTKGAVHAGNVFRQPPPVVEGDGTLRGTPCCPGVVRGTVRVIRSTKDDLSLNGEILVAARTDPGWVPLYPSASGLLIERGSLLSHSAIMAREHGLPAIVNIPNLIAQVEDGMTVEMDAAAGVVKIIDEAESA